MTNVTVVHWNPRRGGRRAVFSPNREARRRVDNFGDLLGPEIVRRLCRRLQIDPDASSKPPRRLLAVGSILKLARDGDVVWGVGVNGKSLDHDFSRRRLDVRAVRGPLTAEVLGANGHDVPAAYGDPGLLVGRLWDRAELTGGRGRGDVCVIPNFHDFLGRPADPRAIDPRLPLPEILAAIAGSRLVVGSSLHGVVVAESMGIPARFVRADGEPAFKYRDYLGATGRADDLIAETVEEAVDLGGQPPPDWDPVPLLRAFPVDLWTDRTAAHDAILTGLAVPPSVRPSAPRLDVP